MVQPQRKPRKAIMLSGSLRNVKKIVSLTIILRSNLALVGCWRAFHPVQVNVAGLTGEYKGLLGDICKSYD